MRRLRTKLLAALALCLVWSACASGHPASGIVVDESGNTYFIHTGRGVGEIDARGHLTYVYQNSGGHFLALDPDGAFANATGTRLFARITPAGVKPTILFASGGAPLVVHRDGKLYFGGGYPGGDDRAPGGLTLARMAPDGTTSLLAASLKEKFAGLNEAVTGLANGPDGSLYVACPNAILKVSIDGTATTLVHPVVVPDCDLAFEKAKESDSPFFHAPYLRGLDVTADGTIYAAVTGCRRVIKIAPDGKIETILKSEGSWSPTGIAVHDGRIFVLEYGQIDQPKGWQPRVRVVDLEGKVTTLVEYTADGTRSIPPIEPFGGSEAGDKRDIEGIKFCWCPAGTFTMGSPPNEPERRPGEDQVEVTLSKGFWIGKFEVTQGQWKRVVGAFPGERTAGEGDDFPVYTINFAEAEGFCHKLTEAAHASGQLPKEWEFRLPTEAQWEYACRAGTTTATSFGDKLSSKQANFQGEPYNGAEEGPSLKMTAKVGSYPPNPWGIYDMHGNAYEWCRDWYHARLPGGIDPDLHSARSSAALNRTLDVSRVRRGGCWADKGWPCRSAFRLRFEPERRHDHIGFRIVAVRT